MTDRRDPHQPDAGSGPLSAPLSQDEPTQVYTLSPDELEQAPKKPLPPRVPRPFPNAPMPAPPRPSTAPSVPAPRATIPDATLPAPPLSSFPPPVRPSVVPTPIPPLPGVYPTTRSSRPPPPMAGGTPLPVRAPGAAGATPFPLPPPPPPGGTPLPLPPPPPPPLNPAPVAVPLGDGRDLPRYSGEAFVQAEATRVDAQVDERARAMNAPMAADPGLHPGPPRGSAPSGLVEGPAAALFVRVRIGSGQVPLWSLLTPLVIVTALVAALAASAVSETEGSRGSSAASAEPQEEASATVAPAAPTSPPPDQPASAEPSAAPKQRAWPNASPLPARSYDTPPGELSAAEILGIADERANHELNRARRLKEQLNRDPGLVTNAETLAEIRRLSDLRGTAREVLGAIAALPGAVSADLLYEIWTGTVERNESTELARSLLYSKDVRPKASPALSVALDLRIAETCEANQAVLERATRDGDRRSFHLLAKLHRRYGCGANKRQDCYPCLREGDALDKALAAVRERRSPEPFEAP